MRADARSGLSIVRSIRSDLPFRRQLHEVRLALGKTVFGVFGWGHPRDRCAGTAAARREQITETTPPGIGRGIAPVLGPGDSPEAFLVELE